MSCMHENDSCWWSRNNNWLRTLFLHQMHQALLMMICSSFSQSFKRCRCYNVDINSDFSIDAGRFPIWFIFDIHEMVPLNTVLWFVFRPYPFHEFSVAYNSKDEVPRFKFSNVTKLHRMTHILFFDSFCLQYEYWVVTQASNIGNMNPVTLIKIEQPW